jgi:hypothetical protein
MDDEGGEDQKNRAGQEKSHVGPAPNAPAPAGSGGRDHADSGTSSVRGAELGARRHDRLRRQKT